MPDSQVGLGAIAETEAVAARRRVEWACWKTRDTISPTGIVSFYIDLNTEGIYLGGSLWRFEGYINLRPWARRRA